MGSVGWVGSQIRQHGACDGDESKDDPGDSSRHRREHPVQFFAARRSASRPRQRLAGVEECIPLCWRSTSTVNEEIPLCAVSQLIPQWTLAFSWSVVQLSGVVLDADAACSHFDDGCTAVQSWRCQCTKTPVAGSAGL